MIGKAFLSTVPMYICVLASLAVAAPEDVRGVRYNPPELKVIEEKCLNCHNRKLIENAVQERKNMDKVLLSMEKKGVALTENDRSVIGHFWQQHLFKEKKGEGSTR